jgi:magnesium-transporting ATPase (P-type)
VTATAPSAVGLSSSEAARQRPPGSNRLSAERPPSPVRLLVGRMLHFFALLLGAAAVLALVGGMPQLAVAIVVVVVLTGAGRSFGEDVPSGELASASGAAFAAVVLGQVANAWACRSSTRPSWRLDPRSNPLLVWAAGVEFALLAAVLAAPRVAGLLGHALPPALGLGVALFAVPAVLLADAAHKGLTGAHRRTVRSSHAGAAEVPR